MTVGKLIGGAALIGGTVIAIIDRSRSAAAPTSTRLPLTVNPTSASDGAAARFRDGAPSVAGDTSASGATRRPAFARPGPRLTGAEQARRAAMLARLTGRTAARRVWKRALAITADDAGRDALQHEYLLRTSEDVAAQLGQMRGVLMKFAQLASTMIDTLPPAAAAALGSLHQDAPPMSSELAAGVIRNELGAPPGSVFAWWNPNAVAAASIGQVHTARDPDGRSLAVKVQYPRIDETIRADLANTRMLSAIVGQWFSGLDTSSIIEELRDRFADELDYRVEAANQMEFAALFAEHPWIRIPQVVPELSSTRVLTTEWADGERFDEFAEHASESARQRSAELIWRSLQYTIHHHQLFHGDPHPGNFRFHRDGTVSLLDFGLVKRWAPGEWDALRTTLDAVVIDRDPHAIFEAMQQSGFVRPGAKVDPETAVRYVSASYEPYLVDEFEFTPQWLSTAVSRTMSFGGDNSAVTRALNLPASFVVLNRVVWGSSALLSRLGARGPYRAMLLEYLRGEPPATELGAIEHEWRRRTTPPPQPR